MNLNKSMRIVAAIKGIRFFGPDDQGTQTQDPPVTPPPPADNKGKTYTEQELQERINKANATEKRSWQQRMQDLDNKHKELQTNANLTAQEKEKLEGEIETLRQSMQTREQQQLTELESWKKKYETDTKKAADDREGWKNQFKKYKIGIDISQAAVVGGAINPSQIDAILRPMSDEIEEIGPDGKPTGNWVTVIAFDTTDKDGKPLRLKLSPPDAIKAMKDKPDQYGNLFKTEAQSGLDQTNGSGKNGSGGSTRIPEMEDMTIEEYKKYREEIRKKMTV